VMNFGSLDHKRFAVKQESAVTNGKRGISRSLPDGCPMIRSSFKHSYRKCTIRNPTARDTTFCR
ncbi:MAG: hypothetical protein LKK56_07575, partial [Prevotella sp.]|nr:hypothetical protein [Prevotella sp.]